MGGDQIEESARLLVSSSSGGSIGSRWVDGSEVEWEVPKPNDKIRRRLVKRLKRVNAFDVKSMEISTTHEHHSKDHSL
ncbi:putative potassium transporter 12 [Senna tora]|uniref:Putative potassium transporter 12 n=1 Tax=Senna tora TaxID=362788 RepID=A0A834TVX4_9FABA|nr:putative potassium transporter 12 [Senna tora]